MPQQGTKTSFTPYHDIRDFLSALEAKGKLRRIRKEVDHNWELSCLARWMYQGLPAEQRFGLLFENVKGFNIPVMTGVLGASPETYAIALQTPIDKINRKWLDALANPTPPQRVEAATARRWCTRETRLIWVRYPFPHGRRAKMGVHMSPVSLSARMRTPEFTIWRRIGQWS